MTGRDKIKKKPEKDPGSGVRSGIDVAGAVMDMITEQYPGMDREDAMRLAVMLTKAQFKGEI